MDELEINSWSQFINIVDHLDFGDPTKVPYSFRGHANKNWRLQPTLLRSIVKPGITGDKALELEKIASNEFKSQAHIHLSPNEYTLTQDVISWWTIMQHHGAPTRMLDWTKSVYVAAYFAVSTAFDTDGAVILVHINSLHSKMEELYGDVSMPKDKKALEDAYLQQDALYALKFVERLNKSERMVAQQGLFCICRNVLGDHESIMTEAFKNASSDELYRKLIIPKTLKKIFLGKLRNMNVTASALFPGLDGLGKSVKELLDVAP